MSSDDSNHFFGEDDDDDVSLVENEDDNNQHNPGLHPILCMIPNNPDMISFDELSCNPYMSEDSMMSNSDVSQHNGMDFSSNESSSSMSSTPVSTVIVKKNNTNDASTETIVEQRFILECGKENDTSINCTICLQPWEENGEHRPSVLKCGHMYGKNCIVSWITQSVCTGMCPNCKAKTSIDDIRPIFAQRVFVLDLSKEQDLQTLLAESGEKVSMLKRKLHEEEEDSKKNLMESQKHDANVKVLICVFQEHRDHLERLAETNERLLSQVRNLQTVDNSQNSQPVTAESQPVIASTSASGSQGNDKFNISLLSGGTPIPTVGGNCRIMCYAQTISTLFVANSYDYGPSVGPTTHALDLVDNHTATVKIVERHRLRDMCLNQDEKMLTIVHGQNSWLTVDPNSMQPIMDYPNVKHKVWSCAHDIVDNNRIYFGGLGNHLYVHDIRYPTQPVSVYETEGVDSRALHIYPMKPTTDYPYGGVIVGKLQSVWFFEYTTPSTMVATKLPQMSGPWLAFRYDKLSETLLCQTRFSAQRNSEFIIGRVIKMNNKPVFKILGSFDGGKATPYIMRPTQISVPNNTLIMGFKQDTNTVLLYDQNRNKTVQKLKHAEKIYDMCPIRCENQTCVAALTSSQVRIFRIKNVNYSQ